MSLWRHLRFGWRALTRRDSADQDIADEVDHFFREAVSAFEADGLPPAEAERAARRALGHNSVVREQVQSYGWEHLPETFLADLRHGARRLNADRGFAAVSIVTLALGIGASTAIFSAVNPILFQPLPYPNADRVVTVWDSGRDGARLELTFGTYRELEERNRSFDALAVMKPWQPALTGSAEPERLEGQRVSARYFQALGVTPAIGRNFDASDDQLNGPRVAIISDGLLRRRFGADPAIVGRTLRLDEESFTVIGVMPASFENVPLPAAEIWSTLHNDATLPIQGREWGHHLRMVGRLLPDVGVAAASQELDAIARDPLTRFQRPPWAALSRGPIVRSLQDDVTGSVKPAMLAVLAAVLLLLALACVNVANLLLGRGVRRRAEFALRAALGAEKRRLVLQLMTESLLLAAMGGAVGVLVARLGVRVIVALSPATLPRAAAIGVDSQALAFALAISAVVGLVAGVIPARQATRTGLHGTLLQGARSAAGGHRAARHSLVILEVALALVLLVGAGLLLRSLQHLFAISPGFNSARVLTMQVQVSGRRFDKASTDRFFADVLRAVEGVPGVTTAAFTSQLPLSGERNEFGVALESNAEAEPGFPAFRYAVTPSYFDTLELPLRYGRLLDARDGAGAPRSALVSESFARRFPGGDAVGHRVHIGPRDRTAFEVVGVVGDVRQMSLALSDTDAIYVTPEQWHFADNAPWLVVRGNGDPMALVATVKAAVWSVDKDQPIVRVASLDNLVAATAAERRFALVLLEAFGIVALLLAAIGIYGLLSGIVSERSREIGIRSALGASRGSIVGMVVGQAMSLTMIGLAAGVFVAGMASRGLTTLLFGITHLDVATYAGGMALLILTSLVACLVPAWRAAWVDPTVALRLE